MCKNNKTYRLMAIFIACYLMVDPLGKVAYAAEIDVGTQQELANFEFIELKEEKASTYASDNLADFSGVYYGWLDVPFTVTNSSRTVKVTYSVRALNGSSMKSAAGIKTSNGNTWFWSETDLSGNSQILTVGKLSTGDYVLRIKTNQNAGGYAISGQVYYY